MELLHLCSMQTVGWAPSSNASRDYKLVGDQCRRGAVDPSLLVVAQKRMAALMSFYQKSRHIYLYLYLAGVSIQRVKFRNITSGV